MFTQRQDTSRGPDTSREENPSRRSVVTLLLAGLVGVASPAVRAHERSGPQGAPDYEAIEILSPAGYPAAFAWDLNDEGDLVGQTYFDDPVIMKAARWTARPRSGLTATSLATPSGEISVAYGTNDRGEAVGSSALPDGSQFQTVLWRRGRRVPLAVPDTTWPVQALRINRAGWIIGNSNDPGTALLWTRPAEFMVLPGLGSAVRAQALNDEGTVVGHVRSPNPPYTAYAVRWDAGRMQILPGLGSGDGDAYGINRHGTVVGSSLVAGGASQATYWQGTSPHGLNGLPGQVQTWAFDINDQGDVVGVGAAAGDTDETVHAMLWSRGRPIDLNGYLDAERRAAGWTLVGARRINNKGWILASAMQAGTRASSEFLLRPVTRPNRHHHD